jgi:hypothetical protein
MTNEDAKPQAAKTDSGLHPFSALPYPFLPARGRSPGVGASDQGWEQMTTADRRRVTYRPPPSTLLSRTRQKTRRVGLVAAVLFVVAAVAFVIFVACACQTFR